MRLSAFLVVTGLCALWALSGPACGDANVRDGTLAGYQTCEDISGQYHFQVMIPPWKHNKEYRCSNWDNLNCVGTWTATGRYVYVVSDVPFINFDSEIITSLDVEIVSGTTAGQVLQLITDEAIGESGSTASFIGSRENYPRTIVDTEEGRLAGHEILWRQERAFQGKSYNWFRRDVFLQGTGTRIYHLRFFSIYALDGPEFEALVDSFREGPSEDGAPNCQCRDEHDPSGARDC